MFNQLHDVRVKFERLAKNHFYSIDRNNHGEYCDGETYNLWVGYWLAKVDSKELTGENTDWLNANK